MMKGKVKAVEYFLFLESTNKNNKITTPIIQISGAGNSLMYTVKYSNIIQITNRYSKRLTIMFLI